MERLMFRAVVQLKTIIIIMSPCTKKDIDCIEKVQRQFTKKAPWLKICVIHRSFKMP